MAGIEDNLGPGLRDDAQQEGDDATQHPIGLQQPVFVAAATLGDLLRLPIRVSEQSGNLIAFHTRALGVEIRAR